MSACLVPSQHGPPIPLDKAIVLIGRHPACDFVLTESRKISRRHCCVAQVDNDYVIRDLGSMNGILVNGEKVKESRIRAGDRVAIGDVQFVFQLKNRATAPPEESLKTVRSGDDVPGPRKAPIPANLSQEIPVAIPDSLEFSEPPEPRNPIDSPTPQVRRVLQLDSGVIELRDISDSGVK